MPWSSTIFLWWWAMMDIENLNDSYWCGITLPWSALPWDIMRLDIFWKQLPGAPFTKRDWHRCLATCLAPSHYLNQHWLIINWTLRNKLQWNFNQNMEIYIHKNAFENVVCEMAAILPREIWVKKHVMWKKQTCPAISAWRRCNHASAFYRARWLAKGTRHV